jgi:xylan 1,4-beta-xylosidase
VTCLGSQSGAVPSLGLVHYDWWNEATHGVASGGTGVRNDASTPYETNFAFPITTAMSFNRSLWGATGAAIAREARAFANAGNAYATFWAPVINLAREPRWGRNIECPGEDPLLTGAYAATFVLGFERSELDGGATLQASACCKHYVANSMESSTDGDGVHHDRNHFDAAVTQQDLLDSYMPAFQACVEKGRVSGLMCSCKVAWPPPLLLLLLLLMLLLLQLLLLQLRL